MIPEAESLLSQWAEWSRTEGAIPKKLSYALPNYYREIPTDYPEEPDHPVYDIDDQTAGRVDAAVARLSVINVKAYVVILDVYRNHRHYHHTIEEAALRAFISEYWSDEQVVKKAVAYG